MFGVLRRYGIAQTLRATVSRSIYTRSTAQLPRWKLSPVFKPLSGAQLLHSIPPTRLSASAGAQEDEPIPTETETLQEFTDLKKYRLVDPRIVDAITNKMNITTMTEVQSKTFRETLQGDDVLAQAKTGTGKTIAFLVPILQRLLHRPKPRRSQTVEIGALIISPTRELAEQIAEQARAVAANTQLVVQTAVGGTGKVEGLRRIWRQGCDVLVGTPGRLQDVLSDESSRIGTSTLSAFVLDEADRLLDEGFSDELTAIQDLLPDPTKVDRQTLMFSATVARDVMHMVRRSMKPNFNFIKTVRDDEVPVHLSVPQKYVILNGLENALPAVFEIAKNYEAKMEDNPDLRPFKAIVYFNTTAEVALANEVVRRLDLGNRSERFLGRPRFCHIHSRLSQMQRTRNADNFRRLRSAILLSSDVTARGMDFPDVTHVIQVGKPRDRDTYIHRLGRTARANKTGEGWVLLHRGELSSFDDIVGDLPFERDDTSLTTAGIDMSRDTASSPPLAAVLIGRLNAIMPEIDYSTKKSTYMALLSSGGGQNRRRHIQLLNRLATVGYKLEEPPAIAPLVARKMGLDNVPGVNIAANPPYEDMVGGDRRMSRGGFGERRPSYGMRRAVPHFQNDSPRSMFTDDQYDNDRGNDRYNRSRSQRRPFTNDRNDRRRRGGLF